MNQKPENLGKKVVHGAFWTVAMRMSVRLIGIISVLIMARLLVPDDFGIMAKASMIQGFLELIIELGLENYLIKNQSSEKIHYDTAWTIHVLRGLSIAVILVIVAHPASVYLKEASLNNIIYCLALISFLRGFINIGTVDFRKYLKFDLDFRINLYTKLASFFSMLIVASIWQTYWAFVVGMFFGTFTHLIASFVMSPYRPNFCLKEFNELFHFSKWIFGFGLIKAIALKLDTFLLSRYSTTQAVGLFTVSYEVAGTPSTEIGMPVARAILPGLSKLTGNHEEFRSFYLSTLGLTMLLVIPAGVGFSALSATVTAVLLGDKWAGAAPLIHILALFGIARAISSISVSAFVSFDKPDMLTKLSTVDLFLKLLILPVGLNLYGLDGLVFAILIAGTLQMLLTLVIQHKIGMLTITGLFGQCWRTVISSVAMHVVLTELNIYQSLLSEFSAPLILFIEVTTGASIFFAVQILLWLLSGRQTGPEHTLISLIKKRYTKELPVAD